MMIPGFTQTPMWIQRGADVKTLLRGLCHANPIERLDAAEALSLWTHGAHPLISSASASELSGNGADWVKAKREGRPS